MRIHVSFMILFIMVSASEFPARLLAQHSPPAPSDPPAKTQGTSPTYNQLVSAGYDFLKEGKLKEAYVSSMEAAKRSPSRFEAYALAALVLSQQGITSD